MRKFSKKEIKTTVQLAMNQALKKLDVASPSKKTKKAIKEVSKKLKRDIRKQAKKSSKISSKNGNHKNNKKSKVIPRKVATPVVK